MTQKSVPAHKHVHAHTHTLRHTDTHAIRVIQTHMWTHRHIHVNTYLHTYKDAYRHRVKDIQTHTHTHTHRLSHQHPSPISLFCYSSHTPSPLLRGRARPSRKTVWQDSLPRLLSVLCGPPSQIPVSQHESRHEWPFIFGKRRCGHVSGSWGREPWPQPGGLVSITWNEESWSDQPTPGHTVLGSRRDTAGPRQPLFSHHRNLS